MFNLQWPLGIGFALPMDDVVFCLTSLGTEGPLVEGSASDDGRSVVDDGTWSAMIAGVCLTTVNS